MRTLLFTAAIALTASVSSATVMEWPIGLGGNGHLYEAILVPGGVTWETARASAITRGGYLATLTSQAENDFVFQAVANDPNLWFGGSYGPWLGGSQPVGTPNPAANWSWVTGEVWSYTNWGVGEPNDGFGALDEHYLHFDNFADDPIPGSQWNDYRDDNVSPIISFVVEYPVPAPTTALAFVAFGLIHARRRSRE